MSCRDKQGNDDGRMWSLCVFPSVCSDRKTVHLVELCYMRYVGIDIYIYNLGVLTGLRLN